MNQQFMNQLWTWDSHELRILDQGLAEAHARAGEHAHCRSGCFSCCLGPFPITALDALRLQRGLDALRLADPPRASRLAARAAEAWAALLPHFPGDPATATLHESAAEQALYAPHLQMLPCPALDLESGACDLYHHRPVACRTFGLAVRVETTDLTPCPLNYSTLTPAQWEPLRLALPAPSPPPAPLPSGLTVVAAALARFTPASSASPSVGPPATVPAAPPTLPASPASADNRPSPPPAPAAGRSPSPPPSTPQSAHTASSNPSPGSAPLPHTRPSPACDSPSESGQTASPRSGPAPRSR